MEVVSYGTITDWLRLLVLRTISCQFGVQNSAHRSTLYCLGITAVLAFVNRAETGKV